MLFGYCGKTKYTKGGKNKRYKALPKTKSKINGWLYWLVIKFKIKTKQAKPGGKKNRAGLHLSQPGKQFPTWFNPFVDAG